MLFLTATKLDEKYWHFVLKTIHMESIFESDHTAESSTRDVRTLAITTDTVKLI